MNPINRYNIHRQQSTLDLVNGIHVTITFNDHIMSQADIYKKLPDIVNAFYGATGIQEPHYCISTDKPTINDLNNTEENKGLLFVFAIHPNRNTSRCHLHCFCYFLHQHNVDFGSWKQDFERRIRALECVSSSGSPIYYTMVTDDLDSSIRKSNSLEPLHDYIHKRTRPSLMHYFLHDKQGTLLYSYVPRGHESSRHLVLVTTGTPSLVQEQDSANNNLKVSPSTLVKTNHD